MKKILTWLYMLNKRLYKRATYVGILLLIFLSVFVFVSVSRNDSGFVHIVLTQMPGEAPESSPLIEKLLSEESILRFTYMEHPDDGIQAVKAGQADALWIFPSSFRATAENPEPSVRVLEREQTVFLRLAREKLYGLLFESSAKALFVRYSRENLPVLHPLTDEELLAYFENCKIDEDLFLTDNPINTSGETLSGHYLTAPLRGLLAILCALGGLAGVLYNLQDEERKIFSALPVAKRPWITMMSVLVSALNIGIVSLLALWGSGLYAFGMGEIFNMLLLVVCTLSFSMVLKELLGTVRSLGSMIPTLIIAMIFLCPVFFRLKEARWIAYLFPPTYYIYGAYNSKYILYGLVYCLGCFLLTLGIRLLKKAVGCLLDHMPPWRSRCP